MKPDFLKPKMGDYVHGVIHESFFRRQKISRFFAGITVERIFDRPSGIFARQDQKARAPCRPASTRKRASSVSSKIRIDTVTGLVRTFSQSLNLAERREALALLGFFIDKCCQCTQRLGEDSPCKNNPSTNDNLG